MHQLFGNNFDNNRVCVENGYPIVGVTSVAAGSETVALLGH